LPGHAEQVLEISENDEPKPAPNRTAAALLERRMTEAVIEARVAALRTRRLLDFLEADFAAGISGFLSG